jgi:hypothetical protein
VSTIAPDLLRELDEDTRRAWNDYRDRLSGMEGRSYEEAEPESWSALQEELRRLERRRTLLGAPPV